MDREQGGAKIIEENGIQMHSLFKLSQLLNILQEAGKIEESTVKEVAEYIQSCQIKTEAPIVAPMIKAEPEFDRTKMSFETRSDHAKCLIAKKLFRLMATKETNLCVAADLPTAEAVLDLVEKIGPYICVLKTHSDIIDDFNQYFAHSLMSYAAKYNFLILEDRKFADIGNTVSMQYGRGVFKISDWTNLVTCHSLPGKGVIDGLKKGIGSTTHYSEKGVFLVAELSSKGNLINEKYTKDTMELAMDEENSDFIAGIVCQTLGVVTDPGLIQLTPGVQINNTNDELSQQYNSPETVVKEMGADVAVVGRGITEAANQEVAAKLYRDQLWAAYRDRIKNEDKKDCSTTERLD